MQTSAGAGPIGGSASLEENNDSHSKRKLSWVPRTHEVFWGFLLQSGSHLKAASLASDMVRRIRTADENASATKPHGQVAAAARSAQQVLTLYGKARVSWHIHQ